MFCGKISLLFNHWRNPVFEREQCAVPIIDHIHIYFFFHDTSFSSLDPDVII